MKVPAPLFLNPRFLQVVAVKHCYCQLLHQAVVVRALELFPDQRMKAALLRLRGFMSAAQTQLHE